MNGKVLVGNYKKNGVETSFNYGTDLTALEKIMFVKNVIDNLFIADIYNTIVKDLFFDFEIINAFTDIDISYIDGNNAVNEIEKLVANVNVEEIKSNLKDGLISDLVKAVELNITYKTGIKSDVIADSLASLLNTIERKIENIDVDSIMNVSNTLSNISGDFTPEKLIEAYSKSDAFLKTIEGKLDERNKTITNTMKNVKTVSGNKRGRKSVK